MDKRPRGGATGGEDEPGKRARGNLSTGEDGINAACAAGILCLFTVRGPGGPPGPLGLSRFHRIPTHFPLNLHGI